MDKEKLNEIIEKHRRWINGEKNGVRADLVGINLRHSDLRHSDLSGCNLNHSDLSGSNIDYACWPLWCGSLDAHIDDHIARQLLYHLMRPCLVSPYVSEDFKRALFTPELIAEANKFHRAKECGFIDSPYEEDDHGQSNEEDAGHD